MTEEIVKHLCSNGFDASIEKDRILTRHNCDKNYFEIIGGFESESPRGLPIFYLRERKKYGSLAHIGWNNTDNKDEGMICEGVVINRHIDYENPHIVYIGALKKAVKTIEDDLTNSEYNEQEIINEFTAHWRHSVLNERNTAISFVEPGNDIKEIEVYKPIPPTRLNYKFFIKEMKRNVNEEYMKTLVVNSQLSGSAIYLPVNFILLPPNPNTKIMDWWFDLLQRLSWKNQDKLKTIARRNHSRQFWILGSVKIKDMNHGWFCILFSSRDKQIPPLFCASDRSSWEAVSYDVNNHIKEYIVPRGGSYLYQKESTIVIIGCGSVGAEIARQLASSGINNLWLIDPDSLSIENTYRHFLGSNYLGGNKAFELSMDLKKRYPYVNATMITQLFPDDCINDDFLAKIDGIIVATGSPTEERYFNEKLFKKPYRPWVIYCWVEGHGVGGHAVYVHNSGKGCLNCLYKDAEGIKSLESIQNFLSAEQEFTVNLAGCGSHFLPYSFTDAIQTSILATRLALLAVEGDLNETCRMSWKNEYANKMKLKTKYRYRAFNNSLNIEPLYWEDCDVCNL